MEAERVQDWPYLAHLRPLHLLDLQEQDDVGTLLEVDLPLLRRQYTFADLENPVPPSPYRPKERSESPALETPQ